MSPCLMAVFEFGYWSLEASSTLRNLLASYGGVSFAAAWVASDPIPVTAANR